MLSKLHYHPKWVEYGFLDSPFLHEQIAQFETGDDKNTEHFRYAAFRRVLETPEIDDRFLERYIELAELDEDVVMGRAALGLLVRHKGLTNLQLDRIKGHRAFAAKELQEIIERTQLLRELDYADVTEELFARCISSGKDEVQRKLISKSGLSRMQLAFLSDHGANKAVRNLANVKLRRLLR